MNRFAFVAVCCLWVGPLWGANYPSAVLTDNPLAYYRLDEVGGTTAADIAGAAQNGVYRNAATAAANPPTAGAPLLNQAGPQAPAFPGFSATNAAVQLDGANDHMFVSAMPFSNQTRYTYEAWVLNTRPNNAQAITGYVGSRGINGTNGSFDALGIMGTFQGTQGSLFLFNNSVVLQGTTAMPLNQWHHVAYTRDGTNVAVYLNGALQASSSTFANTLAANSNDIHAGQRADNFAPIQGRIDEVAVYDNQALTARQINAHYNAAFSTGLYSINNAGFELQNVDLPIATNLNQTAQGDGAYSNNVLQGWWGNTPSYGVFDTTNAEYAGTSGDANSAPGGDGDQVGYITTTSPSITTVSQTLPDPIQAGEYTFTLAIGSRLNRPSAGYELEMLAGDLVVASETDAVALPSGSLIDRAISFSVDANSPLIGQLLTLQISNTQSAGLLSTDFDNARLTFTPAAAVPEPSSLVAMLLAAIVGVFVGRKLTWRKEARS